MVEKNQQEVSFSVQDAILESNPYLAKLFNAVDELIVQCAKENNADLTELKRFVAGHVAKDDSKEFKEKFHVLEKKKETPTTDWNALMSMSQTNKKRPRFDEETMDEVRQLNAVLSGSDKARAQELRSKIDERKEMISNRNIEQVEKNGITGTKESDSYRMTIYKNDLEKIRSNLRYMYLNYGASMVLVIVNEESNKQLAFPPLVIGNCDSAEASICKTVNTLGYPLYLDMLLCAADKKSMYSLLLANKDKASLIKILKDAVVNNIKIVDPKAGKTIDWKKFFDGIDNHKINNWPTTDDYKPSFVKDNVINLKAYTVEQLTFLITSIKMRKITFIK